MSEKIKRGIAQMDKTELARAKKIGEKINHLLGELEANPDMETEGALCALVSCWVTRRTLRGMSRQAATKKAFGLAVYTLGLVNDLPDPQEDIDTLSQALVIHGLDAKECLLAVTAYALGEDLDAQEILSEVTRTLASELSKIPTSTLTPREQWDRYDAAQARAVAMGGVFSILKTPRVPRPPEDQ